MYMRCVCDAKYAYSFSASFWPARCAKMTLTRVDREEPKMAMPPITPGESCEREKNHRQPGDLPQNTTAIILAAVYTLLQTLFIFYFSFIYLFFFCLIVENVRCTKRCPAAHSTHLLPSHVPRSRPTPLLVASTVIPVHSYRFQFSLLHSFAAVLSSAMSEGNEWRRQGEEAASKVWPVSSFFTANFSCTLPSFSSRV